MSTIFAKVPFGSSKGGWGSLFFACYHQPGLHSDPGSYLLWDAKGKTGSQNDYMAEKQIYHRDLKVVDNTMDFLGGKKKPLFGRQLHLSLFRSTAKNTHLSGSKRYLIDLGHTKE